MAVIQIPKGSAIKGMILEIMFKKAKDMIILGGQEGDRGQIVQEPPGLGSLLLRILLRME